MLRDKGFIVYWSPVKKYGFIEKKDVVGKQIFFHMNDIEEGWTPNMGDSVTFEIGSYKGKTCAINICRYVEELEDNE